MAEDRTRRRPVALRGKAVARNADTDEATGLRVLRYVLTGLAPLLTLAGAYGISLQATHAIGAQTVSGVIVAAQRPMVEVALTGGGVVRVERVTRNTDWYRGKAVEVACRGPRDAPEDCRMTTNFDRWIDSVGGFVVGLLLGIVAALLWRRVLFREPDAPGRS